MNGLVGLTDVRARLTRAARDFGRDPAEIALVCVSKTVPIDRIRPVLAAGERIFGENRVQEARAKWIELKGDYAGVELHLIGPLQTNKARDAVELFDVIESVDRPRIAKAIASEVQRFGRQPGLFIEVNTGREPQKAGVLPDKADQFIDQCRREFELKIDGLMCIPPESEPKSPHFALLAQIAKRNGIFYLSMGMSADFELAIQLGATHVRVGTAIFGHRS
jgi:PLP dependent protein